MAALDFPASPTVGQIYTANGRSWKWDGVSWISANQITSIGVTGSTLTIYGSPIAHPDATSMTFANSVTLTAASTKTLTLNGGAGSNGLVIDASNNVGIGTASPGAKLDVRSNSFTPASTTAAVLIEDKSAWTQGLQFYINLAGTYNSSRPSGGLGPANSTAMWLTSGSLITNNFGAASGITAYATAASIYQCGNGAHYWYGDTGLTAGNTYTQTLRMTLDTAGNLHIPGGGGIASNEAFGTGALKSNTTGTSSTACGQYALYANTTGYNNTASGYQALLSNTTGVNNTADGVAALFYNTTGIQNTACGASALQNNTTGNNNVGIGFNATSSSITVSNEVNIYNGSVTARFQGAASSWSFVSDARDKTNVEPLTLGLDFVTGLQPRKFKWDIRNCDVDKGKEASGFIAQEVLEVIQVCNAEYTGLVDTNDPNQYTIATGNLIPILVNAIKELKAELETLKQKVNA